jgi:hypothetical protein
MKKNLNFIFFGFSVLLVLNLGSIENSFGKKYKTTGVKKCKTKAKPRLVWKWAGKGNKKVKHYFCTFPLKKAKKTYMGSARKLRCHKGTKLIRKLIKIGKYKQWRYFCTKNSCPIGGVKTKDGRCICGKNSFLVKTRRKGGLNYCVRKKCLSGQFRGSDKRCWCPAKQVYNKKYKRCIIKVCPPNTKRNFTGSCIRVGCRAGTAYSSRYKKCTRIKCPRGKILPVGKSYCVRIKCPGGLSRDPKTKKCRKLVCKGKFRFSKRKNYCVLKKCINGKKRDKKSDRCKRPPCPKDMIRPVGKINCVKIKCPKGSIRDKQGNCKCPSSKVLSPNKQYCVLKNCGIKAYRASDYRCYPCKKGMYRPGKISLCVLKKCPAGSFRAKTTKQCKCPKNKIVSSNGLSCVKKVCGEGHSRNKKSGYCACSKGFFKPKKNMKYCVPKDCGSTKFRGKNHRCVLCAAGKYRPEGADRCFWKPCPKGRKRGSDGRCKGAPVCDDSERISSDGTKCVPKVCPKGTKRDPITETCIRIKKGKKRKIRIRCKVAYHGGKGGTCVRDECLKGQFRNSKGVCYYRKCPRGFFKHRNYCVHKVCPKKSVRNKKTKVCRLLSKFCPKGTFKNPTGKCVPFMCSTGKARPSDNLTICLRIKRGYARKCSRGRIRNRRGKCIKKRKMKCPKSSRRIGNRCFYGVR